MGNSGYFKWKHAALHGLLPCEITGPKTSEKKRLDGYLFLTSIVCKAASSSPNTEPISIHKQASAVINICSDIQEREDFHIHSLYS